MNLRRPVNSHVMLHEEVPVPLDPLKPEEEARIALFTESELNAIDEALLSNALPQWRKVAMVVALTTRGFDFVPSLPDVFYAGRIKQLVAGGRLESQGNLEFMRFSEVRLPQASVGSRAT
jgi:uncharacterized protein DUF3658